MKKILMCFVFLCVSLGAHAYYDSDYDSQYSSSQYTGSYLQEKPMAKFGNSGSRNYFDWNDNSRIRPAYTPESEGKRPTSYERPVAKFGNSYGL